MTISLRTMMIISLKAMMTISLRTMMIISLKTMMTISLRTMMIISLKTMMIIIISLTYAGACAYNFFYAVCVGLCFTLIIFYKLLV